MEELRRRTEALATAPSPAAGWVGDAQAVDHGAADVARYHVIGIEPRDTPPPPNVVTVAPGMTMVDIERAAITAALKETRGNRRRAAEMLGIGERTLYRKLREYQLLGVDEVAGAARS
jgi:DNA-binding NtrC family response regulator